jgi:predicted component of type VI protein secretion system
LPAQLKASYDATDPDAPAPDPDEQPPSHEVGRRILTELAARFVPDQSLTAATDLERFGKLLQQTLEVSLDWIAKCLQGRQQFEDQFGAEVTLLFALAGNPIKSGGTPDQIGAYLLDWAEERDLGRVRADLEAAYRDLTAHQLGLIAGAQEAVRAVLERLSPASIERLAASKEKGWLQAILPGSAREWDYYKEAYKELVEERGKLFDELFSPSMRKGYLASHEQHSGQQPPDPQVSHPKSARTRRGPGGSAPSPRGGGNDG